MKKLIKGIVASTLLTGTLPAHAVNVYYAVDVEAKIISYPKGLSYTKNPCKGIYETYDCSGGTITTRTLGKSDTEIHDVGQKNPRLRKVCDVFKIED